MSPDEEVDPEEGTAPRDRRDPQLLPHERAADLLRVGHGVQPARHRPLGSQLQVHQLLRLVRRVPSQRVRSQGAQPARVLVHRGDLQLPAGAQGGRRLREPSRRGWEGHVPDVRRGDRAARERARAGGGVPIGLAPPPAGFEDRHHPTRERGGRSQRAQRDGSRERLRRAHGACACRRTRRRRGGADAVRRLRADDVLHRGRGGLEGARDEDRRSGHQGDAEDRSARVRDRRGHHATRHPGRAADGGAHRVPGAHAVRRRLVRQRRLPRCLDGGAAGSREGTDVRDGRASAPRGLPRVLRARLLGGRVLRRDVPGRAQPAGDGRIEHHERDRGRVRRHALVPVPSARVHGRGVRDRCRRAQRPMGASRQHRRLDAVHPQADGRSCGADRRGAGVRRVEHGRRPYDLVRPA